MPGIVERLKAAAEKVNSSKLGKWLDSHPVDRMNQAAADKVVPKPTDSPKPDLSKAIQAVQTKVKPAVRFASGVAPSVPMWLAKEALERSGNVQSEKEKAEIAAENARNSEMNKRQLYIEESQYMREQERIMALRKRLTENN